MNRETLIAIFLGFTGGILVAFLLITVPKRLPQAQNSNVSPTASPDVDGSQDQSTIKLDKPEESSVIEGEETDIEGITVPNSKVVISGPSEDVLIDSTDSGSFKSKITVYEGYNQINITVYTKEGQTLTLVRNIYATKETL